MPKQRLGIKAGEAGEPSNDLDALEAAFGAAKARHTNSRPDAKETISSDNDEAHNGAHQEDDITARAKAARAKFKKLRQNKDQGTEEVKVKWVMGPDGKMKKKVKRKKHATSQDTSALTRELQAAHASSENPPSLPVTGVPDNEIQVDVPGQKSTNDPEANQTPADKHAPELVQQAKEFVTQSHPTGPAANDKLAEPIPPSVPSTTSEKPREPTPRAISQPVSKPAQKSISKPRNIFKQAEAKAKREKLDNDDIFSDASSDYDPFAADASDGEVEPTKNEGAPPERNYFSAIGVEEAQGKPQTSSRAEIDSALMTAFKQVKDQDRKPRLGHATNNDDYDIGDYDDDDDDDRPKKKRK